MGWIKAPLLPTDSFEIYSTLEDFYVGGANSSIIAKPDLVEDEIVFISYSRSSHVVGDDITVSLSLKLVANGIS